MAIKVKPPFPVKNNIPHITFALPVGGVPVKSNDIKQWTELDEKDQFDVSGNVEEMPENIKNYKDLPLVSTGCDSYASWDPRFKHLSPVRDIDYLACNIKPRCGAISFNNRVATMYCGSPCRRII